MTERCKSCAEFKPSTGESAVFYGLCDDCMNRAIEYRYRLYGLTTCDDRTWFAILDGDFLTMEHCLPARPRRHENRTNVGNMPDAAKLLSKEFTQFDAIVVLKDSTDEVILFASNGELYFKDNKENDHDRE